MLRVVLLLSAGGDGDNVEAGVEELMLVISKTYLPFPPPFPSDPQCLMVNGVEISSWEDSLTRRLTYGFRYKTYVKRFSVPREINDRDLIHEADSVMDYFLRAMKTGVGMIGEL